MPGMKLRLQGQGYWLKGFRPHTFSPKQGRHLMLEDSMDVLLVIFSVLLVKKLVDFVRYLVSADTNGAVTQLLAWAAGILVLFMAIWADWGPGTGEAWPRILMGLYIGSGAGVLHDLFKAIAQRWTTAALLPSRTMATPTV
jgi:hypothetical protein